MNFQEQFKYKTKKEIWDEYCGFLDLSIEEFMEIQNRLMLEQLTIWKKSQLGQSLLKNTPAISNLKDFRRNFKLTTYKDYADLLLTKNDDILPSKAVIWIMTTWEGGIHPIKVAPYSANMIESFKDNVFACMILASSSAKYEYDVVPDSTFLYGLAPLPYATGLLPRALSMNIDIKFLPNVEEAEKMSFKERNKLGFKLGLKEGIDYFFGLGSVAYYISKSFADLATSKSSQHHSKISISKRIAFRYLKAKKTCKKEERDLEPKDIFKLKGFMVTGTDMDCYKDELTRLWGIKPLEVFAGTEPTCIGCEDYNRNGLYFFPDACFYEFIKEEDMLKCIDDESYNPKTYLFNEVEVNQIYELVISVLKGGAFMRYRVKDLYRCVGKNDKGLPRFKYIDRALDIIDIAGFTRITQKLIDNVIKLSNLPIKNYVAIKEYKDKKPFLHMYIEIKEESLINQAILSKVLRDHLSIYFKYLDTDYQDLKKILGIDPLKITILKCHTFEHYQQVFKKPIRTFNPNKLDIIDLLSLQQEEEIFDPHKEVRYE